MRTLDDLNVRHDGPVAIVSMNRPPHNFVDVEFMQSLLSVLQELDANPQCRVVALLSEGKNFCAGADFSTVVDGRASKTQADAPDPSPFYAVAMQLFATRKPIVAGVQGAAIGAGLGLALVADFRVTCAEARLSANFLRLGFHPGFALSYTLPRLIGIQKAGLLFYTGRRVGGEEAVAIGLADELVPEAEVASRAIALAQEIAIAAPLAVASTRSVLRQDFHRQAVEANRRELAFQLEHFRTEDFREGIAAMATRRQPNFQGR